MLIPIRGIHPQRPTFLAPNAVLIGDVRCGPGSSVWFGAVLRADINHIIIGERTNVQDNCVLHVSRRLPCILGNDVSVGHAAVCHACTVGDGSLVGMGAQVLDGAVIGAGAIIAAGAVVPEGMVVPPAMIAAGVPARIVAPVSPATAARFAAAAAAYAGPYQELYRDAT
jgi:carbonic anhydrase/acetyltransferase-like protein (isoleucine patch superfamily)